MAFKHPLCGQCYYHNRAPELCEQCEDASEFEAADEMRRRTEPRPPRASSVTNQRVDLALARRQLEGISNVQVISIYKKDEE